MMSDGIARKAGFQTVIGEVAAERAALVALLRRPGAGWADIAEQIQHVGSAVALLERVVRQRDTLLPAGGSCHQLTAAAAAEIRGWEADRIGVHAFFDSGYPPQLREIREMPPLLFTRGTLSSDTRAIAVVGSRGATEREFRIARAASIALAKRQITVVSGLAKGIETAVHEAALEAGGRTVAVTGTGLRRYCPATKRRLQEQLADVDLIISPFWPDTPPTRRNLPVRNAVMSGYAAATVVVEAGRRSGARIQAQLALQHGRPVVLTSQVMRQDWAQEFAGRPGVYVARGALELLDAVETILRRVPSAVDLESFPGLAAL